MSAASHHVARRIAEGIVALLLLSVIAFALPRLGGDPTVAVLGPDASLADRAELRSRLGLDDPLIVQYQRWILSSARGDFGRSYRTHESALGAVAARLPATIVLAVGATVVGLMAGVFVGILAAIRRGSRIDSALTAAAAASSAAPAFWIGLILLYVFSYRLRLLPFGDGTSSTDLASLVAPSRLLLPVLALSVREAGRVALLVRAGLLDALEQRYATVALGKGLTRASVVVRHALPNAMVPLISASGLSLAFMLGGAIAVETVFGWPGLGRLMADSAASRDFPVLAVGMLAAGALIFAVNVMADLAYLAVDPRSRHAAVERQISGPL